MKEPVLVVLAAGMGSRYGGLKQIDKIGKNGEILIDYSIYDALKAGFKRIVFIINHKIEKDFKEVIGERISKLVETVYVYQELDSLMPAGCAVASERVKPWGTVQAILCCEGYVDAPFAVINSDDYYGKSAFTQIYDFLKGADGRKDTEFSMVGYELINTLTDYGTVTRGVCETKEGYLSHITEVQKIEKRADGAYSLEGDVSEKLSDSATASMNFWGFTPKLFSLLKPIFEAFVIEKGGENPLKAELPIPSAVGELLESGAVSVYVMKSEDKWHGVTYIEDKPELQRAIAEMVAEGSYPEKLW
jgi:NDP-sugar pyrophosphorylase family protein